MSTAMTAIVAPTASDAVHTTTAMAIATAALPTSAAPQG